MSYILDGLTNSMSTVALQRRLFKTLRFFIFVFFGAMVDFLDKNPDP